MNRFDVRVDWRDGEVLIFLAGELDTATAANVEALESTLVQHSLRYRFVTDSHPGCDVGATESSRTPPPVISGL